MHRALGLSVVIAIIGGLFGVITDSFAQGDAGSDMATLQERFPVVPWPENVTPGTGSFVLGAGAAVSSDEVGAAQAQYLAEMLRLGTGLELPVVISKSTDSPAGNISLIVNQGMSDVGPEGYRVSVVPEGVILESPGPAGMLYACQTLRQLLSPEVFGKSNGSVASWRIPCVTIVDRPRFPWRGLMLDPARFFLTPDFIKKYIDLLAMHKMNRLHLHLTDSEAWTLEIKAYPELTNMERWPLKVPERTRGVYTQEDMKELVRYGALRNVVIVPEIELPAHSCVAMACYPELMCPNNPLRTGEQPWGPKSYEWAEYCLGSEKTYEFIRTVLAEVMEVFSSPEIHVGGDEYFGLAWKQCPLCRERIQSASLASEDSDELRRLFAQCTGDHGKYLLYRDMMRRVCAVITKAGRRPMLWDDLSWRGKYPANVVVNQWHYQGGMDYMEMVPTPENPAVEAARTGHDVVVSPFSHLYFDLGDPRNTELVYSHEPMPEGLTAEEERHILGPHAPAWNQPQSRADEMIFPRLVALSEVGWTARDRRDGAGFVGRCRTHYKRLGACGIKFPKDWAVGGAGMGIGEWTPEKLVSSAVELDWDATSCIAGAGDYEVVMLFQKGEHGVAIDWVALLEDGREIARDTHHGWSGYGKDNIVYVLRVPERTATAKYTVRAGIDCHLGTDSTGQVLVRRQE